MPIQQPRIALSLAALLLGSHGCSSFESRSIALDLRVLGIVSAPPEVMVPLTPDSDLGDLPRVDIEACAIIADPAEDRALEYRMTACWPTENLRCDDPERAVVYLAGSDAQPWVTIDDPDQTARAGDDDRPGYACGSMRSDLVLATLLLDQLQLEDSLAAIATQAAANGGNLDVQIELAVRGLEEPDERIQYASKRARFALPLPPERVANQNPTLVELQAQRLPEPGSPIAADPAPRAAPTLRCADASPSAPSDPPADDAPLVVGPGDTIDFIPIETDGAREDYLVPTFDGGARMFTENLTYAWYATDGNWQREVSGGPKDFAGNQPPLSSEWTAPEIDQVGDGLLVQIWLIQRDERGGQSARETCVWVTP